MSTTASDKIKYGLKNVYYSKLNVVDNVVGYGQPVKIPGAVSVSLKAKGEASPFYADDIEYFNTYTNNGYEGEIEFALIPAKFRTDILGEKLDGNGVLFENADNDKTTNSFALLFEFSGDIRKMRHVMYNCTCSRPDVEGSTKNTKIEPKTEKLSLTCLPAIDDKNVKARCIEGSAVYNDWFKSVYRMAPTAFGEDEEIIE